LRPTTNGGQVLDHPCVPAADRRHVDDLSFDEFDTIFRPEHADVAHPVIVGDRESMGAMQVFSDCGHHDPRRDGNDQITVPIRPAQRRRRRESAPTQMRDPK
jgi:hypothetical protein